MCLNVYLQVIRGSHTVYSLTEQGVEIESETFDTVQSHVSLTISSPTLSAGQWKPNIENHLHWVDDKKIFQKVT